MTVRARVPPVTEAAWMAQIIHLARLLGYTRVYHTNDSRRSAPGFPDLVLARPAGPRGPARVVAIEVKTEGGRVTSDQEAWLDVLSAAGIPAVVARPADLEAVTRVLVGRPEGGVA